MPDHPLDLDRLPTVARLRADLLAAFTAHEQDLAPADRPRHRRRSRRPLAVLVALVCVVGGGIALAESGGSGSPVSPDEWVAGKRAVPETRIAPVQLAHLSILRRARVPSDVVDARDVSVLSHSTFTGASGANFSLSRRARGFATGAAWVIPAAGGVCIIADQRLTPDGQPVLGSNGAAGCEPNDAITEGRLLSSSGTAREPDVTFVAGLVPDGVQAITATLTDGTAQSIPVHDNIYMGVLHGSAQLSFDGPNGHVTLEAAKPLTELEGRPRAQSERKTAG